MLDKVYLLSLHLLSSFCYWCDRAIILSQSTQKYEKSLVLVSQIAIKQKGQIETTVW